MVTHNKHCCSYDEKLGVSLKPMYMQLISGTFEHSMLHVLEIYALENVGFYIVVYGPYKP